jgi:hypothetical protein
MPDGFAMNPKNALNIVILAIFSIRSRQLPAISQNGLRLERDAQRFVAGGFKRIRFDRAGISPF